jgi:hypothetical protein
MNIRLWILEAERSRRFECCNFHRFEFAEIKRLAK